MMQFSKPYQSKIDWIVFDGVTKHRFASELEAWEYYNEMITKLGVAQKIINHMTTLADVDDLLDIITAHAFKAGQANAITDEDVAELGITAAQFNDAYYILEQVMVLLDNGVPAQGNFRATVDVMREL